MTADFLAALFEGVDDGFITLVRLPSGGGPISTRIPVSSPGLAEGFVEQHKTTLYYNVGVTRTKLPDNVRGGKSDVAALTCLWADIDLPKADGKDKKYPPYEVVTAALDAMPLKYTALVHTGGGLHVYWVFNEPYLVNAPADIERFERTLSQPWTNLIATKLAKFGDYQMDRLFDIARMLRIPGSFHKNGKPCVVLEQDFARRYSADDFLPFLEEIAIEKLLPEHIPQFTRPIEGRVSNTRLETLLFNSAEFKKVWNQKKQFDSGSEADASVAYHGITAGWSDEDVADLIYSFNEKNSPERLKKLLVKDSKYGNYLGRTISAAHRMIDQRNATMSLGDYGEPFVLSGSKEPERPEGEAPPEEKPKDNLTRADYLQRLSLVLKVPVAGWVQIGYEQPVYTLILNDGRSIRIGSEAQVFDKCDHFLRRLYSVTHEPMARKTAAEWTNILKGLGQIVEVIEVPEVTASEQAYASIRDCLERSHVEERGDEFRDRAIQNNEPFHEGRWLYLHVPATVKWANQHGGNIKWTQPDFVAAITQLGFKQEGLHYVAANGRRSHKSYWHCADERFKDLIGRESPCLTTTSTE